ncbi:MAG: hypothetical protein ACI4XF_11745 [Oscillospiraceae bacterium]
MTDTEFLDRIPKGTREPTDKEFEKIQFVYNYHPSINSVNGKDQIAMLYSTFGMRIICDMYDTAKRAQALYDERMKLKAKLREVERAEEELAML